MRHAPRASRASAARAPRGTQTTLSQFVPPASSPARASTRPLLPLRSREASTVLRRAGAAARAAAGARAPHLAIGGSHLAIGGSHLAIGGSHLAIGGSHLAIPPCFARTAEVSADGADPARVGAQVFGGGGECGLDNIRTLCVLCHADATARQAALRPHRSHRRAADTSSPRPRLRAMPRRVGGWGRCAESRRGAGRRGCEPRRGAARRTGPLVGGGESGRRGARELRVSHWSPCKVRTGDWMVQRQARRRRSAGPGESGRGGGGGGEASLQMARARRLARTGCWRPICKTFLRREKERERELNEGAGWCTRMDESPSSTPHVTFIDLGHSPPAPLALYNA
jgi:hypothetical protein